MSLKAKNLGIVRRALAPAILFALATALPAQAGENWLTGPEQEFFAALGVDARINGTTVKRTADLDAWPAIAQRAQQPLKGRIQAISAAYQRMPATEAERKELESIQLRLQAAMKAEMGNVVLGAFFGKDSFDQARESTANMMNVEDEQGRPIVRRAWDLQRTMLLRGLEARKTADKNLAEITDALARRTGKVLPADDFEWSMMSPGKTVTLYGHVGDRPLKSPVVQLTLYRKSTGGQWIAANGISSGIGMGLGVMNERDAASGTVLSAAQEEAMNLPLATTFVLPDLEAGSRVTVEIELPLAATLAIERAELQVWTDQGKLQQEEIAGLDAVQRRAQQDLEKERAAAQGQPGPLRQMFQPPAAQAQADPRDLTRDQQKALAQQKAVQESFANQSLKMAKNAISAKNDQMAKYYLQDTIRKAPDSAAARTAKRLLKKYE
ncbi:hypothetical protein [Blastopirellula marina]|uniref:Uncharacterized protein n=1 Tax=Blastopirellula marina TaxID=124 RepID=A0A2S8GQP7_9BACT|nr:hypothetical protein [Blastopirellula marina]PQO46753.1 hypothetical protein C5Y93_07940 [Blastopirellula marina]